MTYRINDYDKDKIKMEHTIIYNKTRERYEAYEDNILSGYIDIEIKNGNSLKIIDIKAGSTDPNYRTGTELVLYVLNQCDTVINIIHGTLSTADAPERKTSEFIKVDKVVGWKKSIPFYADLVKYIPNSRFYLYDSSNFYCKNDITNEYYRDPDACIERLIAANQDCSFSITIDTI